MAWRRCGDCGEEISTAARYCAHCGAPREQSRNSPAGARTSSVAVWSSALVVSILVATSLTVRFSSGAENRSDSQATRAPVVGHPANLSDCELEWAKISNADLRGDQARVEVLKGNLGRMEDCL